MSTQHVTNHENLSPVPAWAAAKEIGGFVLEGIAFAAFAVLFCLFVAVI